MIDCLEDWELLKTDFSRKNQNPGMVYLSNSRGKRLFYNKQRARVR